MTYSIRQANDADKEQLLILTQSFPSSTPPNATVFKKIFEAKLSDPSSFLAVAESESTLLGYVSGYRHNAFYASGQVAWIDEIYVHPNSRGQGLGDSLISKFENWASKHQCKLVGLATHGARDFYTRLGYESIASYYKKYLPKPLD